MSGNPDPQTETLERLTLEVDSGTSHDIPASRLHFYESSLTHAETGEPLVSVATRGPGMRLTRSQVKELYCWLSDWLAASSAGGR